MVNFQSVNPAFFTVFSPLFFNMPNIATIHRLPLETEEKTVKSMKETSETQKETIFSVLTVFNEKLRENSPLETD
jgi:hypothetical protein